MTFICQKKQYVMSRPHIRPAQIYTDYSSPAAPFHSQYLDQWGHEDPVILSPEHVEYLSFVGIRADEPLRVAKMKARNQEGIAVNMYAGEHVMMPLYLLRLTKTDIVHFWSQQRFDLALPFKAGLSNCTYCFLKGDSKLHASKTYLDRTMTPDLKGTPSDIQWWVKLESRYQRDPKAEGRDLSPGASDTPLGFFPFKSQRSYQNLASSPRSHTLWDSDDQSPSCDCTD